MNGIVITFHGYVFKIFNEKMYDPERSNDNRSSSYTLKSEDFIESIVCCEKSKGIELLGILLEKIDSKLFLR